MVNVRQVVFSLLGSQLSSPSLLPTEPHDVKRIAIIGAGSAGLAMFKTLLDLSEATTSTLDIVVFEERHAVGGIWLPDPDPPLPPKNPETPLYPLLHTNTPVPVMSCSDFPYSRGTPLFPSHEHVESYLAQYASHYNLTQQIRFNHTVLKTSWTGNATMGHWDVIYRDANGLPVNGTFDHLVVATGNNHIPRVPTWQGQDHWLGNSPVHGPKREVLHSIWYRGPDRYAGRRVLIVGAGSSGRDIASQIVPYATETFISMRHEPDSTSRPLPEGAHAKPDISYFTSEGVVFKDGTTLDVDAVLLATGYPLQKPFLDNGHILVTDRQANSNESYSERLVTNTDYIFPLHRHIFSLSPSYPVNALAFIGLPRGAIGSCSAPIAQSLFAAHAILNSTLLPARDRLLKELVEREDSLRKAGYDPYTLGHTLSIDLARDYQNELVKFLKKSGAIADDGKDYVEPWRIDAFTYNARLRLGWQRIQSLGTQREWLDDVETEEQWAELLQRINVWQEEWERSQGISPSMSDWDLL